MVNEHIVHVIKKIRFFVNKHEYTDMGDVDYYAPIYDGGTLLNTIYGETEEETLGKAVEWIHEHFDIPKSLEIMEYKGSD